MKTTKKHRKPPAEAVARLTRQARSQTAKAKALHGKNHTLDAKVADFLAAVFAGLYPLTDPHNGEPLFDDEGEQVGEHCELITHGPTRSFEELAAQLLIPPALVPAVFGWILQGNHQALRTLSDAVRRVHARANLDGGGLAFNPVKHDLAKMISRALAGGKSGEEIADLTPYTPRTGRRIAEKLGIPPKATKWQR